METRQTIIALLSSKRFPISTNYVFNLDVSDTDIDIDIDIDTDIVSDKGTKTESLTILLILSNISTV